MAAFDPGDQQPLGLRAALDAELSQNSSRFVKLLGCLGIVVNDGNSDSARANTSESKVRPELHHLQFEAN